MLKTMLTGMFLALGALAATAQGISDSVFHIQGVSILAEQFFLKEEAGMKQTRVDTLVLQNKINLSLSELLSENTPVFIKNHGRGALATASFRGSSPSHTQVSWNGLNINSPMAGMVDFSLIPVYLVDELSLNHGSASLADRSGGIGGSINIGNRADWDNKYSLSYLQGIGSYRTFDEYLHLGIGNSKIQGRTRVYHNRSDNDYTFFNRGIARINPVTGEISNPLDTNHNASYLRFGLMQELYYRPGTRHMLSMKYWGQSADRSIPAPTSYEGPGNANLNRQEDRDHRLVADWKFYGNRGKLVLQSGYADKLLHYSQKNLIPGLGQVSSVWSESRQKSLYNALSFSGGNEKDLSWDGRLDLNHHQVLSEDTVSGNGYKGQRNEISTMLAMSKNFVERVHLKLLLRQEWIDGERMPFIPYLGMDVRLIRGVDLLLKGNVARNYHMPTLNDLYWQPGGNPDLSPEEGYSLETGMAFQKEFLNQQLKAELTLYRSKIKNWIIWLPSHRGYWEPRNISQVLSKGLELNVHYQGFISGFTYKILGGYGYTSAVNHGDPLTWGDASMGKQLPYIPLHSGNLMLHLGWENYFITYQYNAYSERFTSSSNEVSRRDRLYPYFMNDISAGSTFRLKKVEFSLEFKVCNILNESYRTILYRPMPGRNYQLVLHVRI